MIQGLELKQPRLKVAMEISHTLSMVCDWLQGECAVKYELQLLSSKPLVSFLYSFLAAKLSHLSVPSLQHLVSLLLQVRGSRYSNTHTILP